MKALFPRVLPLCVIALTSTAASAQWWSFAPRDYEECAASAEKAPTGDARKSLISECDSKFAGRRKSGGGYSYYDFMQNRSFDIAGPNPTPEELQAIDEEYIGYLERQRRSAITAAFLAKQKELAEAGLNKPAPAKGPANSRVALLSANPQRPAAKRKTAGSKAAACKEETLSCSWSKFSTGVRNLFSAPKQPGSTRS